MKTKLSVILSILFLSIGLLAGCNPKKETKEEANVYYTCPMHPEVHEHSPGKCPICGMDLVKKEGDIEGAK